MSTIAFAAYLQYGRAAMFYCYCYAYSTDLIKFGEKNKPRSNRVFYEHTIFFYSCLLGNLAFDGSY